MRSYLSYAIAYIEENGDELERARLAGLLGRARPEPKIARTVAIRQNEDGGYPYGMIPGRPSAIASTVTALQWTHDLQLTTAACVERAVGYLLSIQRPEGTWDENPAVLKYDPPPLLRPGQGRVRLYCTALVAYWLARLVGPAHDTVLRASKYLGAQRAGGWPADESVETAVLIAASAALVDGPATSMVTGGLDALSRLAPEAWTTNTLTEMLAAFAAARLTRDHALIPWGVEQLCAAQRADGGWTSVESGDHDVDLSLRALGALFALGVSAP